MLSYQKRFISVRTYVCLCYQRVAVIRRAFRQQLADALVRVQSLYTVSGVCWMLPCNWVPVWMALCSLLKHYTGCLQTILYHKCYSTDTYL